MRANVATRFRQREQPPIPIFRAACKATPDPFQGGPPGGPSPPALCASRVREEEATRATTTVLSGRRPRRRRRATVGAPIAKRSQFDAPCPGLPERTWRGGGARSPNEPGTSETAAVSQTIPIPRSEARSPERDRGINLGPRLRNEPNPAPPAATSPNEPKALSARPPSPRTSPPRRRRPPVSKPTPSPGSSHPQRARRAGGARPLRNEPNPAPAPAVGVCPNEPGARGRAAVRETNPIQRHRLRSSRTNPMDVWAICVDMIVRSHATAFPRTNPVRRQLPRFAKRTHWPPPAPALPNEPGDRGTRALPARSASAGISGVDRTEYPRWRFGLVKTPGRRAAIPERTRDAGADPRFAKRTQSHADGPGVPERTQWQFGQFTLARPSCVVSKPFPERTRRVGAVALVTLGTERTRWQLGQFTLARPSCVVSRPFPERTRRVGAVAFVTLGTEQTRWQFGQFAFGKFVLCRPTRFPERTQSHAGGPPSAKRTQSGACGRGLPERTRRVGPGRRLRNEPNPTRAARVCSHGAGAAPTRDYQTNPIRCLRPRSPRTNPACRPGSPSAKRTQSLRHFRRRPPRGGLHGIREMPRELTDMGETILGFRFRRISGWKRLPGSSPPGDPGGPGVRVGHRAFAASRPRQFEHREQLEVGIVATRRGGTRLLTSADRHEVQPRGDDAVRWQRGHRSCILRPGRPSRGSPPSGICANREVFKQDYERPTASNPSKSGGTTNFRGPSRNRRPDLIGREQPLDPRRSDRRLGKRPIS